MGCIEVAKLTADSYLSTEKTTVPIKGVIGHITGARLDSSVQISDEFFGKPRYLPGTFVYRDAENYIKRVSITQVIYANPATIVFWDDGTKTVSKCYAGDVYNGEAGLSMCIIKKLNGGANTRKLMDAWAPKVPMNEGRPVTRTLTDVRKNSK